MVAQNGAVANDRREIDLASRGHRPLEGPVLAAESTAINGFRVDGQRLALIEQKVLAPKRCAAERRSWESSGLPEQPGDPQ